MMKAKAKRKTKIEKIEERILAAVRKGDQATYNDLFMTYRCAVVPSAGLTDEMRRQRFGILPR